MCLHKLLSCVPHSTVHHRHYSGSCWEVTDYFVFDCGWNLTVYPGLSLSSLYRIVGLPHATIIGYTIVPPSYQQLLMNE